jgi:hypothetical protein
MVIKTTLGAVDVFEAAKTQFAEKNSRMQQRRFTRRKLYRNESSMESSLC